VSADRAPSWLAKVIWPQFCSRHDKPVTRWHYRRCKHRVLVLDELVSGELLRAGGQLYRIAGEAYRLSRNGGQVMSLGQRDTMYYALQRWERAALVLAGSNGHELNGAAK
jgi:hypothetical protein